MIDAQLLEIAARNFNPYRPSSGTEHVAFLLYALARMGRPKVVIEYGSGYSTLFLLRALADNRADEREERTALLEKSKRLLAALPEPPQLEESDRWLWADAGEGVPLRDWVFGGAKACAADPDFYRDTREPHVYSFDQLGPEHAYIEELKAAVLTLGHEELFTHVQGRFSASLLPSSAQPIDWAWNDADDYQQFFSEIWPLLNPSGGLLIFHNVSAVRPWFDAVNWMKNERAAAGDLEVLTLEEPHKLNQNGCAILRKVSAYQPRFGLTQPGRLWQSSAAFVARHA